MKLYSGLGQPNPRRVTIYLAEKGVEIPIVTVDTAKREQRTPEFLRKNPLGKIPVLELDDGSFLPESAAIVEYLEDRFPAPPMIGVTPEARAQTRATERMIGDLFAFMGNVLLNSHPYALQRRPGMVQYPDVAKALQPQIDLLLGGLEARVADGPYFGGARPNIADCSLFALMQTCETHFDYQLPAEVPRLGRLLSAFADRASAQAA